MQLSLPRTILVGGGTVRKIGSVLQSMRLSRPLIVADPFLASPESGAVSAVCAALGQSHVKSFDVFSDTIPDPTTESVSRCVDALAARNYDCVVALGGGSPIDTAKWVTHAFCGPFCSRSHLVLITTCLLAQGSGHAPHSWRSDARL